jgi:hypothetical protein
MGHPDMGHPDGSVIPIRYGVRGVFLATEVVDGDFGRVLVVREGSG